MMDILLQPDWDPGGSIPDSVGVLGVVIPPKRCNVMNPGPVMVSPKVGMPCAGLGSSTLHQVQVQVQVFSFFILQVQVQVQVQ